MIDNIDHFIPYLRQKQKIKTKKDPHPRISVIIQVIKHVALHVLTDISCSDLVLTLS